MAWLENINFEKKLIKKYKKIVAIDEAGRGSLVGPLVVAGILLENKNYNIDFRVKDSKLLNSNQREKIFQKIKKTFKFKFVFINEKKIDKYGIIKAEVLGIKKIIKDLKPKLTIIDGLKIKELKKIKNLKFFVHGDRKLFSLACASIIAKVKRDNFMKKLSLKYPNWNFEKNKGYGTKEHLKLIKVFGPLKIHRKTFIKNLT
jgi:ribonuclease HII